MAQCFSIPVVNVSAFNFCLRECLHNFPANDGVLGLLYASVVLERQELKLRDVKV